jgi:integrase/recombinase XerD
VSRRFSVVAGFYRTCVIDGLMPRSPAEHVRRPAVPAESPTLGLTHLQFEALLTAARESPSLYDFALVAMLSLLGLRIFEATGANIADLGEEHGHRVLRVCGKGSKVVQVPLPPAVGRALDRATGARDHGPILLHRRGLRMDRHAATRRLRRLAQATGLQAKVHPHMLRHTFVTTSFDGILLVRSGHLAVRSWAAACAASSVRVVMPSLAKMWDRCTLTVPGAMNSRRAMASFRRPSPARRTTSSSAGVRLAQPVAGRLRPPP